MDFAIPNQTYGVAPLQVSAKSNSTGALTYSRSGGSITVTSNGQVTVTGVSRGLSGVTVTQAASGNYAASSTTDTFYHLAR